MNQLYATLTRARRTALVQSLRKVQLYKNNALLSRILSNVNSDWLLHGSSVLRVYEYDLNLSQFTVTLSLMYTRSML